MVDTKALRGTIVGCTHRGDTTVVRVRVPSPAKMGHATAVVVVDLIEQVLEEGATIVGIRGACGIVQVQARFDDAETTDEWTITETES